MQATGDCESALKHSVGFDWDGLVEVEETVVDVGGVGLEPLLWERDAVEFETAVSVSLAR